VPGDVQGVHADLEEVEGCTGVEARLFVDGVENCRLLTLFRQESGAQVKFEALGDEVLEFDLAAKDVGSGPSLSNGEAMFKIRVFCLDIAID